MKKHVISIVCTFAIGVFLWLLFAVSFCQGQTRLYELPNQYAFEPDDDFRERKAETDYPTLYEPGVAEGVILVIGFPECGWCKKQLENIPGNDSFVDLDGKDYRVLYVDRSNTDPLNQDEDAPTWDDLRIRFNLNDSYPTTLIIEQGLLRKSFSGFKPWLMVQPFATPAKKQKEQRIRWFDFFRSPQPNPPPVRK